MQTSLFPSSTKFPGFYMDRENMKNTGERLDSLPTARTDCHPLQLLKPPTGERTVRQDRQLFLAKAGRVRSWCRVCDSRHTEAYML